MAKRMLQREDRRTVWHLFRWLEYMAALIAAIMMGLALLA
ncbi:hypothetical protein SAMN05660479_00895 [Microbulbifer thermotolerans]|nr:hypothetical protein SAMN05660479_00895 [Microbulbifer thermotolerans]